MGANSFLVRYSGGWAERKSLSSISTYGRQEALLGLGALSSLAEVNRVADGQLNDFATPREQTDILIDPRWNGEAPYYGWQVGDTITVEGDDHRVLAVAVTEDPNNDRVIFVPSLNDNIVINPQERVAQAINKMVRGTLGGRSKVAQPVVPAYVPKGRSPAPGVSFSESFDKADGALGPDLSWETMDLDPGVLDQAFSGFSPDFFGGTARCGSETRTDDQYVQAEIVRLDSSGAGTILNLITRHEGTALSLYGGYFLDITDGTDWTLYRTPLGSTSALDTATQAVTIGDVIRLESYDEGASVRVIGMLNGVEIVSALDASPLFAGSTLVGMAVYNDPPGTLAALDNFEAGDL